MASSTPSDAEQEKADQQQPQSPPPPMAAPVRKPDPFSYDSVFMLPALLEQLLMSAIEEQENPQEGGTDDEDVADGLLRLSLGDDPVTEDAKDGDEAGGVDEGTSTNRSPKLKRSERKNRKTLEKLGMQPVTGICTVTMLAKSEKQKILISFPKPDVFKFSNLESYAIFGEGSSEARVDLLPQEAEAADDEYLSDEYDELTDEGEDDVDETGIPPGDVDIVMEEAAGVSRRAAVKALKRRGGDVVLAIMDLDPLSE